MAGNSAGDRLFYYDNRDRGGADYLIDDYDSLSAISIEVKAGNDYTVHSALRAFAGNEEYRVKKAFALPNEREIGQRGKIRCLPIYDVMLFKNGVGAKEDGSRL